MRGIPAHLTVMLFASGIFAASTAHADGAGYRTAHPIPAELPGSFCHIEVPHTHTYTPDEKTAATFVRHDAEGIIQLEFVGDPTALGFEGPVTTYGEAHPMHFRGGSSEIEEVCQVEGSHYHLHEPFDPTEFEDREGTYYFESYKTAMSVRRNQRKLRKAEAKELKKAERQQRRADRSTRKATTRKRGNNRVAVTAEVSSSSTTTPTKTTTTTTTKKKKSKPPKKGFRSWMDRRRGK